MAKHRVFLGLEIASTLKRQLLTVKTPLPGARWQSAQQMHITLLFLGSVTDRELDQLPKQVGSLELAPMDLKVTGLGYFGSRKHPKVLWAGVEPVEPLAQLRDALAERLEPLAPEAQTEAFQPHITLARFKGCTRELNTLLEQHKDFKAGEFHVDQVTLFESHLNTTGPSYEILHRFSLAGL